MRNRGERSRNRRSVRLEFLEDRNLLSGLIPVGPTAEVHYVPFKATFVGTRNVISANPPPPAPVEVVTVELNGGGNATHFGKYTEQQTTVDAVFNFLTGTATIPAGKSTATFTLANGDQVDATYSGAGYITKDPVSGDTLAIFPTLTYTITGGTGRYAGATGTIIMDVTVDLTSGVVTASSVEGSVISSVGSLKRA